MVRANNLAIISSGISSIYNSYMEPIRIYYMKRHFEAELYTFVKFMYDGVEKCLQLCEWDFEIKSEFLEYSNILSTKYLYKDLEIIQKIDWIYENKIYTKYFLSKYIKEICIKCGSGKEKGGSIILENILEQTIPSQNYMITTVFSINPSTYIINGNDFNIWSDENLNKNKDYCGLSTSSKIYFDIEKERRNLKDTKNIKGKDNDKDKEIVELILSREIQEIQEIQEEKTYSKPDFNEKDEKKGERIKFSKFNDDFFKKEILRQNIEKIKILEKIFNKSIEDIQKEKDKNEINIILRTIEIYKSLIDKDTFTLFASFETDPEYEVSGAYSFVWIRDMYYILKGLKIIDPKRFKKEINKYISFLRNTQMKDGKWEQRYFSNGKIAPSWGFQIDECASALYLILKFENDNQKTDKILFEKSDENNKIVISRGIKYLKNYLKEKSDFEEDFGYDLWENTRYRSIDDLNIYALSFIFLAFKEYLKYLEYLEKSSNKNLTNKNLTSEKYDINKILKNIINEIAKRILDRRKKADISDLSIIYLDILEDIEKNNDYELNKEYILKYFEKILSILKVENGYLRYENDSYMGGKNVWSLSLIYAMHYYNYIRDFENYLKVKKEIIELSNLGYIPEQKGWVYPLFWAHFAFLELEKIENYERL